MQSYLYLSVLPEALVASHLPPEEYGAYLAIGSQKRSRGQALFFKLTDEYARARLEVLGQEALVNRTNHGQPRRSTYLSIYRVLEQVPPDALESLHLVTEEGRVLALSPDDYIPEPEPRFHLYQEFCPVTPRVVSTLEPQDFAARITDNTQLVSLPALLFADLQLHQLRQDPDATQVDNLPYPNLTHLRDCLRELKSKPNKTTKTVIRFLQQDVLYRTIRRGFYFATAGGGFRFFPMPTREQLETIHYPWWRSALSTFGA
jgi:hypothetical protein